jgi:hypothetical protein
MESTALYASEALAIIVQDWSALGTAADKAVAPTGEVEVIVDRITSLLLVRLVAVVAPLGTYPDLSIASICRAVLMKGKGWPKEVTGTVIAELKEFVTRMVKGYKGATEVPYHNREHCYHVVLSACKLMDMFLSSSATAAQNGRKGSPPSFGLRNDPVLLFSLAFAALVHDVEHQGRISLRRILRLIHTRAARTRSYPCSSSLIPLVSSLTRHPESTTERREGSIGGSVQ